MDIEQISKSLFVLNDDFLRRVRRFPPPADPLLTIVFLYVHL